MKILMVSLVNLHRSEGNAAHQLGLFESWIRQRHDVRLIVPKRDLPVDESWPHSNLISLSPSLTRAGLPPIFDALPQILVLVWYRLFHGHRYLYVRASSLSFLLALAGRLLAMRVVAEHNSWMSSERAMNGSGAFVTAIEERCQLWLAKLAHRSRCVSPGIRDLLIAKGIAPDRLFVVGNGTDTERFFALDREEALRRLDLDPDKVWIGFLGSMNPWQGIGTAVRALDLLREDPKLHLILAGDGPEKEPLQSLVSQLELDDRVIFFGHVNRAEANQIINCFDIAIAPFTEDRNAEIGLSAIKIRDYAAAGRIVVASDLAGIRELAAEGWLHVHEPDNPEKLAKLIRKMADRIETNAVGQAAARQYAEEYFTWNGIAALIAGHLDGRHRNIL